MQFYNQTDKRELQAIEESFILGLCRFEERTRRATCIEWDRWKLWLSQRGINPVSHDAAGDSLLAVSYLNSISSGGKSCVGKWRALFTG